YSAPGGNGALFFLAGTGSIIELQNGDLLGQVTRAISVKQGTAFFFPLLNAEFDNVCGTPHLGEPCPYPGAPSAPLVFGVPQLQTLVAALMDNATGLNATLTPTNASFQATGGPVNLGYQRLQSPPFSYTLPATGNSYQASGINVSGTVAPAVSDGY